MKKIVFILPNLNGGGAERVAATFLRSLDYTKLSVTLLLLHKTNDLAHLISEQVEIVDLQTVSTSKSLPKLVRALKDIKPEVVFTTHSRTAFLVCLARFFSPKFKHVARMQGSPLKEKEEGEYGSLTRLLYSIGFCSADVVVAQTTSMKQEGVQVFKIPESKITVLSNPIDKAYIDEAIKTNEKLFPDNEYSIVAAGRLSYEKGFDLLIEAFSVVLKNIPNAKLHLLGNNGNQAGGLKKLVYEKKLQRQVIFHGFIRNPYPFYKQCDLFVLSSRHEGFPNVVIENFYLNTPIVATECAAVLNDLIIEGSNGYLVPTNNVDMLCQKITLANATLERNLLFNEYIPSGNLMNVFMGATKV